MRKLFVVVVLVQLVVIVVLAVAITTKRNRILGVTTVNPISASSIDFHRTGKLLYFYEPKPNSIDKPNEWVSFGPWEATINADALNERYDYDIHKPENVFRIITLGDSFTYGLY